LERKLNAAIDRPLPTELGGSHSNQPVYFSKKKKKKNFEKWAILILLTSFKLSFFIRQ
jgi:hypothetical protein